MAEDKKLQHSDWLNDPCTKKLIENLYEIRSGFRDQWENEVFSAEEALAVGKVSREIKTIIESVRNGDFFGIDDEDIEEKE